MAVTRVRELRWLRLDSSGKGGNNQSAAAEAGLRQGSAGCQGTAAEGLLAQGTRGERMKGVLANPPPLFK